MFKPNLVHFLKLILLFSFEVL